MKNAFDKEILRSITHSLGRFLAIGLIVALGTGFYAGLRMTAPDMRLAADGFYDGTALYDIRILSTMGLTDDDIEALARIEGVEEAMPAFQTDMITMINGEQYTVRIHSLDIAAADASRSDDGVAVASEDAGYLNRPVLVSGSWPSRSGECVISADRVMDSLVGIGDKVQIVEGLQDVDEVLDSRVFTIVGFVSSSMYSSPTTLGSTSLGSGILQQYMYIPASDFADDLPFTEAFVTVDGARAELSGSDGYKQVVNEVMGIIESLASEREQARFDQVTGDAQSELEDARAELEEERADVQAQLDDARRQLDDASAVIAQSEADLASGQADFDKGVSQLATSRAQMQVQFSQANDELTGRQEQFDAAAAEVASGEAQLAEGWAQWQEGVQAVQAGYAQLATMDPSSQEYAWLKAELEARQTALDQAQVELDGRQSALDAAKAELQAAHGQLESGWQQFYNERQAAEAQIAQAQAQLDAAQARLSEGRASLEEGRRIYEENLRLYEENRAEADAGFAEAEAELADAQREIDDIEMPVWYVMDRTKNAGAESFQSDAGRVDRISQVFPFLFFLVAALVSLTTMTRMVEEERMLIGTYKALGYSRMRISSKYLIYALVASGVGSLIGIASLSQVLPRTIFNAYSIVYSIPQGPTPIDPGFAVLSAGLGIGITLIATAGAAVSTLREKPAALMLPRAPKPGKRILLERIVPLWKRVTFSWKVTFRNIFRYKRRFIMTIIGIAGCTALLLTGLGLSDAINDIISKQYEELNHYNASIRLDDDISEEDMHRVDELIGDTDLVNAYARVHEETLRASTSQGKDLSAYVTVPEDPGSFDRFVTLRERVSGKALTLDDGSMIICEKLANELEVDVGDVITFSEEDEMGNAVGDSYTFEVGGIAEFYIGTYVFMPPVYFEQVTGRDLSFTTIIADATADTAKRDQLSEGLLAIDGVNTVGYNDEYIVSYQDMLSSVNSIVVVLVIAAATLAFVVLYNLTNINITERQREIATLKVLGFIPREVNAYIYRETMLLTILGALFGLGLGVLMENYVVVTAEVDAVMFGRQIHLPSFLIAFALTVLFSILVSVVMQRKLSRINMVESLKSVE